MTNSAPQQPQGRARGLRRAVVAAVLCAAAGFGIVAGLMENKQVRLLVLGDALARPRPSAPHGLRRLVLDRRDQSKAAGELEDAAAVNALLAEEAVLRALAVHDAWMPRRHPRTKLFPRSPEQPEWNYRHTAADFFTFLFHIALYTDAPTVPSLWGTFAAEAALAAPGELCQPVEWSTGEPVHESHEELLFASSEYAKDGLLSLYEGFGDERVYDRLLDVTDAVLAHSRHSSRFGPIPDARSEVNGEVLQVLSRLSLVADRPAYPEMAARIADATIEQMLAGNHGLPAHTFDYEAGRAEWAKSQLRDHGNEIIGGLSEVYALAVSRRDDPAWAERAERWEEPIARMYEIILEHAVNDAGLLVNQLDPATRTPIDAGASDNWGYVLSGALLFTQAAERRGRLDPARLEAILARTDGIIAAVASTNGLPWEGMDHDGYADTIESALYVAAHRPSAAEALLPWVDDQIGIMFDMQQESGFVAGHYLDGNFIRTALMYADLRTGGWRVDPWDPGTRVGMAMGSDGRAALVLESPGGYEGTLRPQRPENALRRALPWNWPRLNSWPEWLPPRRIRAVTGVKGAPAAPTVEELTNGWPISLPPGGRLVLWFDVAQPAPGSDAAERPRVSEASGRSERGDLRTSER